MRSAEETNIALVTEYLAALGEGMVGSPIARFFTPDALQEELPNKLNPNGQVSNLAQIIERSERGKQLLSSQRYTIISTIAQGDAVAVEAEWVGTLAVSLATIPPGGEMRARSAMFFQCTDGRIRRQRNYDSFEPW